MPLELPAIDSNQVSLPPAAEGVAAPEALTEEEQKQMESVGWRMLNLPLIVCHSANGMPFFFPLQKVSPITPSTQVTFQSPLHAAFQQPCCSQCISSAQLSIFHSQIAQQHRAFLGSMPLYMAGCCFISLYSSAGNPHFVLCKPQPSFSRPTKNQPISLGIPTFFFTIEDLNKGVSFVAGKSAQDVALDILTLSTVQVQALVAEHKLGAAGRKLGMAMQKELVNTPERLAKVQSTAAHSWAAINKGKQKSRSGQQAQKQASCSPSRPHVNDSEAAAAVAEAAPADEIPGQLLEGADASPSGGQDEVPDAAPLSGLTKEPTVHFSIPDVVEEEGSAEVSPCIMLDQLPQLKDAVAYATKQQALCITDVPEAICLGHSASAASFGPSFSAAHTVAWWIPSKSEAGVHVHGHLHTLLLAVAVLSTTFMFDNVWHHHNSLRALPLFACQNDMS